MVHTLPVLPIADAVLMPEAVMPFDLRRAETLAALGVATDVPRIVVLTPRAPDKSGHGRDDFHPVGCSGEILKTLRGDDGTLSVIVRGDARVAVVDVRLVRPRSWWPLGAKKPAYLAATVRDVPEPPASAAVMEAAERLRERTKELLRVAPHEFVDEAALELFREPEVLCNVIAVHLDVPLDVRVAMLAAPLEERLSMLLGRLETGAARWRL